MDPSKRVYSRRKPECCLGFSQLIEPLGGTRESASSSSISEEISSLDYCKKINDSVYELSAPQSAKPEMDILFFHGLQFEGMLDPHISTWRSRSSDRVVWPGRWLSDDFPKARILTVSYDSSTRQSREAGRMDIHLVAESLLMDLLMAKVGQDCPVILIGHSFGGLLIKQLCLTAHKIICRQLHRPDNETLARKYFLQSVRAIFYIATPHTGVHFADVPEKRISKEGELLQLVKAFNKELARLNDDFDHIRRDSYSHWHVAGLGETLPTQMGGEFTGIVVEEASARCENFVAIQEDHISICQPKSRESTTFQYLCHVIRQVQQQLADQPYSYPLTTLPGFETYVPIHTQARGRVICALNDDSGPSIILLHGDPGTGKSVLARFITECYVRSCEGSAEPTSPLLPASSNRSKIVIFLQCGHNEDPEVMLGKVHDELHPRIHQSRHLCEEPERCRLPNLLCAKDVLIVIDDVWEAKVIEALINVVRRARANHVKVLATSRRSDLYEDPDVMKVKTEEISFEDAKKMLASHLGLKEIPDVLQESARELIERTGRHPLALGMVAGRITREKKENPKQWRAVAESYSTKLRNEVIDAIESRPARTHYVPVLTSLYERSIGETLLLTYKDLEEDARYLLLLMGKCTGPSTPTHVVRLLYTYALARLNRQCDREPEPFQISWTVLENSGTMLRVERGKVPGLWNFPRYEYETLALHDLQKKFLSCVKEEDNKRLEMSLLEKQSPAETEGRMTSEEQDTTFIWALCVLYLRQDLAEKAAENLGARCLLYKGVSVSVLRSALEPLVYLMEEDSDDHSNTCHCVKQVLGQFVQNGRFDDQSLSTLSTSSLSADMTATTMLRILRIVCHAEERHVPTLGQRFLDANSVERHTPKTIEDLLIALETTTKHTSPAMSAAQTIWVLANVNVENRRMIFKIRGFSKYCSRMILTGKSNMATPYYLQEDLGRWNNCRRNGHYREILSHVEEIARIAEKAFDNGSLLMEETPSFLGRKDLQRWKRREEIWSHFHPLDVIEVLSIAQNAFSNRVSMLWRLGGCKTYWNTDRGVLVIDFDYMPSAIERSRKVQMPLYERSVTPYIFGNWIVQQMSIWIQVGQNMCT